MLGLSSPLPHCDVAATSLGVRRMASCRASSDLAAVGRFRPRPRRGSPAGPLSAGWIGVPRAPLISGIGWARIMALRRPISRTASWRGNCRSCHSTDFSISRCRRALSALPPTGAARRSPCRALRSLRDSQPAAGGSRLHCALDRYFCDGLTDLMFGFEFHTALYALHSRHPAGLLPRPGASFMIRSVFGQIGTHPHRPLPRRHRSFCPSTVAMCSPMR